MSTTHQLLLYLAVGIGAVILCLLGDAFVEFQHWLEVRDYDHHKED